jgi:hypothetical protein
MEDEIQDRFWSKVDLKSIKDCWNFTGCNVYGYGQFWIKDKHIYAHRVAWELYNNIKIPNGKLILHKCDNRKCCNPEHLYCGTQSDNMRDKMLRGDKTRRRQKLYANEIWLIRKLKVVVSGSFLYQRYKISPNYVAKMFKVSTGTIKRAWEKKMLCREGVYI